MQCCLVLRKRRTLGIYYSVFDNVINKREGCYHAKQKKIRERCFGCLRTWLDSESIS